MFNAFDKMTANLQQILDEVCSELNLDRSLESIYSQGSSAGQDVAGTLDLAVWHLLEAESDGLSYVLQAREVSAAADLVRDVLEQLLAEQSTEWATTLPVLKETGCGNDLPIGLSALRDEGTDGTDYWFSRNGATVFVEIDHDSETNFFTDLTSDINRGGLFVATYNILSAGTSLNLYISLPSGHSFPLQGSVSWVREFESCTEGASPGMGITFKQLTSELTAAICRYMTERPPLLFEMA